MLACLSSPIAVLTAATGPGGYAGRPGDVPADLLVALAAAVPDPRKARGVSASAGDRAGDRRLRGAGRRWFLLRDR
jgi:hypothetical protein